MPTKAETYFRDYTAKGAAKMIAALPTAAEVPFENDWMDFKSGDDLNDHLSLLKQLDKTTDCKIRENIKEKLGKLRFEWSRIAGGFANNEGGIIIWGVHAKDKENAAGNKVDRPIQLRPVEDLEGAISLLYKMTRDATDPVISGIEHKRLPHPKSNRGFIVSYVPMGTNKPYRSDMAGNQFYMRSGESFNALSVSNLRALFWPQRSHNIKGEFIFLRADMTGKYLYGRFTVTNCGAYTLQHCRFRFHSTRGQAEHFIEGRTSEHFAPYDNGILHPDEIAIVDVKLSKWKMFPLDLAIIMTGTDCPILVADLEISGTHFEPLHFAFRPGMTKEPPAP